MTSEAERRRTDDALAERARLLARRPAPEGLIAATDLVAFTAGDTRYAIESSFVYRLEHLAHVAPLPGAAAHFRGVANLHGHIVPLVDLGVLLGSAPCARPAFAVVLGGEHPDLAIAADALLDLRAVPLDAPDTAAAARPLVRRIFPDGTALVDAAALIADPRLTHKENSR